VNFTVKDKLLISVITVGFIGASALLFFPVPVWIPATILSISAGLDIGLLLHISRGER
jgi:hypothetical protein